MHVERGLGRCVGYAMQRDGPISVFLRVGYLLLGGWLTAFGVTNYLGGHHPVIALGLHLAVMVAGIIFLLSLFAMSRSELPGMVILSIFLLAMGVIPFESAFHFHSDNLVGVILWGISLLAGCLISMGLAEKQWGDRLSLAFLSVWLIIWPMPAFAEERRIEILFTALLPVLTGLVILANALTILLRPRSDVS